MREIFGFAWKRFNVIAAIIGDVQGRAIATLFYFTIVLPFAVGSRLSGDPLRLKMSAINKSWLNRAPVPTDLESAKRQG